MTYMVINLLTNPSSHDTPIIVSFPDQPTFIVVSFHINVWTVSIARDEGRLTYCVISSTVYERDVVYDADQNINQVVPTSGLYGNQPLQPAPRAAWESVYKSINGCTDGAKSQKS